MQRYLYIKNAYGSVQLTDQADSYFFLLGKSNLGSAYNSTSANCSCTWNDGVETGEAYNYIIYNDRNNIVVLRNPSETEVRLAVAPIDFLGNPSCSVSVTGCTREVADAIEMYIFADYTYFNTSKAGLQLRNSKGVTIFDTDWKPLKITGQSQSDGAMNKDFAFKSINGVILNSGYRSASSTTYRTGYWKWVSGVDTPTFNPILMPSSSPNYGWHETQWWGGKPSITSYPSTNNPIDTFPNDITYQGYLLSNTTLRAMTYVAWSPHIEENSTWVETEYEWADVPYEVQRWDDCAYESYYYDPCASTYPSYDSCASQDLWGNCSPGFVDVCQGGMVKTCTGGFVTDIEYRRELVPVHITYNSREVKPTLDQPSLMYGMEAYPDGTLFIRPSGTSTVGIVDLENYI